MQGTKALLEGLVTRAELAEMDHPFEKAEHETEHERQGPRYRPSN